MPYVVATDKPSTLAQRNAIVVGRNIPVRPLEYERVAVVRVGRRRFADCLDVDERTCDDGDFSSQKAAAVSVGDVS